MAFAFLQTLVLEPDQEQENESYIDFDPEEIEQDPAVDSEMEGVGNGGDQPNATDSDWFEELSTVIDIMEPFEEYVGAIHDLDDDSEINDYFKLFFPEENIDMIVEETNRYAEQDAQRKQKEDKLWKPVDRTDIYNYLAINIIFGLHKLPESQLYWSSDPFWRVPAVADLMGRVRFVKINQFFHINNSANQPAGGAENYDPLYKVRPLLDHVRKQCLAVYKPSQKISVDEAMVGFTGRLGFKQYIKNKPTSWGINFWCCAETSTGYVLNFRCYTGKNERHSEHGQGYDVVTNMAQPYLGKNHIVYFDNFFSSPRLAVDLLEQKTYSCGTIRPNRKGWPYLKTKSTKGTVKMAQKGMMVATQWTDKRQVNVISTNCNAEMTTVTRRTKAGPTQVDIPVPILDYNSGMFGVDLSDQHRSYYKVGRPGQKWWRYIVWYLIQISIVNAFVLYKAGHPNSPRNSPNFTHLSFRTSLVKALMSTAAKRKAQEAEHRLSNMPGRKKACRQCSIDGNKTNSGRTRETVTGCMACNAHLHHGVCYARFHESLKQ